MRRCGSGLLLTLAITFVSAFTGCLGKSTGNSGNGGVTSVSLSPGGIISLDIGTTQVFSASGRDASGKPVLLRSEAKAGHGAGMSLDQSVDEWADALAFAARYTGLR